MGDLEQSAIEQLLAENTERRVREFGNMEKERQIR